MKNTNIVIVVGNLTGDAELKQTATGVSYIQFSIAVNKEAVTEKIKVDANEPITEETLNFEIF